jgi:GTP-binding protein
MVFRPARGAASASSGRRGRVPRQRRGDRALLARYDLDNDEALAHVEARLRQIGVIRALEAQGFRPATRSRSPA